MFKYYNKRTNISRVDTALFGWALSPFNITKRVNISHTKLKSCVILSLAGEILVRGQVPVVGEGVEGVVILLLQGATPQGDQTGFKGRLPKQNQGTVIPYVLQKTRASVLGMDYAGFHHEESAGRRTTYVILVSSLFPLDAAS
jgi:hypothetical protein